MIFVSQRLCLAKLRIENCPSVYLVWCAGLYEGPIDLPNPSLLTSRTTIFLYETSCLVRTTHMDIHGHLT